MNFSKILRMEKENFIYFYLKFRDKKQTFNKV